MDMVKVKIGGKVRLMLKLKKNSSESRRHIVSVTIARYSTPRLHYGCSSYRRRDMALAGTTIGCSYMYVQSKPTA